LKYKQAAVKKIHDGQSVASVARKLGVAETLPHSWRRQVTERSSDADKQTLSLKKRIRVTNTDSQHTLPVAANLLAQSFKRPSPELIHHSDCGSQYCSLRVSSVAAKPWAAGFDEPPR
jgi:transposase-like protein